MKLSAAWLDAESSASVSPFLSKFDAFLAAFTL
jgi:hypothetical protein